MRGAQLGHRRGRRSASFAGQHATYYYVDPSTLEQRIVDCWLSLWSEQALSYRRQLGIREPLRMAVIVQLMVQAEVSGVAFTRDPTGRQRDTMVIESCWGLGAALVDGRVTPDSCIVRRGSLEIVERRIGSKRFKVAEDLLDAVGARLQTVPRHLQRTATLGHAEIREVATLAAECEAEFGSPQDVEWAYANETLYLLQSRPITAITPPSTRPAGRWVAFKPVLENFTDALTPLSVDLLRRVLPRFGQFIDGRYYLDFDGLRRWIPLRMTDHELIELALLRSDRIDFSVRWPRLFVAVGAALIMFVGAGVVWVRSPTSPSKRLPKIVPAVPQCSQIRR